jgi:hypothetical protein
MAKVWAVYTSDWQGETFARLVDENIVAVSGLSWSTSGATADNEMPQHLKVRKVSGITDAGHRVHLPVASNDAGIYSTGGTPPTFSYNGDTYTITGFSGEKRTLPH